MSTTIDSRVLEMRFDNGQFEKGVSTSMSTLDKLKEKLNLSGASKGLENVSAAAGKFKMDGISSAIDTVHAKFSALEVMGMTALANITNSAINAGKRMINAFAIEPVTTGFNEFELKMGSVQTIMASTGASLEEVNGYLNELNEYSDRTIYSFSDMTQNIGKFTNAGVKLEDAVMAIKGISNEAALSGANANEASRAMYNFAQALSAEYVKLIDWKSIENANMATVSFKEQLLEAAAAAGTVEKTTDGMYKVLTQNNMGGTMDMAVSATSNFNDSLAYQWMTTEVLVNTLKDYADETTEIGKKAYASAQDVKTFSMMMDTLKEAAQSGWAQTWELIIGDFEEGKALWTSLSEMFGSLIGNSADARNELLGGALNSNWQKIVEQVSEAGISVDDFQEKVKEAARAHGVSIDEMIEEQGTLAAVMASGAVSGDIIKEAINELAGGAREASAATSDLGDVVNRVLQGEFGTGEERVKALAEAGYDYATVQELVNEAIAGGSVDVSELSDAQMENLGYTAEQIKALRELAKQAEETGTPLNELIEHLDKPSGRQLLFDSMKTSIQSVIKVFDVLKQSWKDVFGVATSEQLYSIIEAVHSFAEGLSSGIVQNASKLSSIFKGLFSVLDMGRKVLSSVAGFFMDILGSSGMKSLGTFLLDTAASIGDFFTSLNEGFHANDLSGLFDSISSSVSDFLGMFTGGLRGFGDNISDLCSRISKPLSNVREIVSGVLTGIWETIKDVFGLIKDHVSIGDIFAGLLGATALTTLKKFAGLLDKAKEGVQSFFDFFKGDKSGGIKDNISKVLDSVHDSLESFTSGIKTVSLLSIAVAVGVLVNALKSLSELNSDELGSGLAAVASMMFMLTRSLSSITKSLGKQSSSTGGIVKTGASLILLAKAVEILADAMQALSGMSWDEIGHGLSAMGGVLVEFVAAVRIINGSKVSLSTGAAMLALAQSCKMLGEALGALGKLSWDEIGRGLSAMGGALGELVAAVSILSKMGGFGSLFGSVGILIAVQSLQKMAEGLKSFSEFSWDETKRGLAAMGGALGELGIVLGGLGKVTGLSSIFGATSILIAVQGLDDLATALESFSKFSWDEIGRGLSAMGGALSEVSVVAGALGKIAGLSGIFGAGAILITVQGLSDLAEALGKFGGMSWNEIGHGLAAMGGALAEAGGISGAIGILSGLSGVLGGAAVWVTIQGLNDLAAALQNFAAMSWDEIGHGLAAMGGALAEAGGISGALGALTGFAGVLGGGAIALITTNINDLADAFMKFSSMDWDEVGRALTSMGAALGETAIGGILNTFSGFGAGAIKTMAEPLGALADSVKKWTNISVSESLSGQLGSLADGIRKFTFTGWGASDISKIASPLGTLADSVKKWSGVSIASGLGGEDGALASLASGIKQFNFTWMAGSSIDEVAGPLGALAESISKWSGVSIPSGLGGENGSLAAIAEGIKKFSFKGSNIDKLSSVSEALGALAQSAQEWSGVQIPDDLPGKLSSLSEAAAGMAAILSENQAELTSGGASFGAGIVTAMSEAVENVTQAMDALVSSTGSYASDFNANGEALGTALVTALKESLSDAGSTAETEIGGALNIADSYESGFSSSGSSLGTAFVTALGNALSSAGSTAGSRVSAAVSAINGYWQSFYNAGGYLGSGLVSGINARTTDAYNAGFALGQAAVQGEKAGQQSNSPSKLTIKAGKWLGEGLIIGMQKMGARVYNAGNEIGKTATVSLSSAMSKISDFITNDIDAEPKIRPVLDLSDVRKGADAMHGLLGFSPAVAVGENIGAISMMMSQNNQNGANDDIVSAIDRLEKSLGQRGGDTYTINGITYDDGSNITSAVKSLIRAARMERRV